MNDTQRDSQYPSLSDVFLRDLEPMAFRHAMMRLDAETSWHDEVIAELSKLRARSDKGQAARDQ